MPRVLVIDDEPTILLILQKLLEAEGCEVVACQDGNAAVDLIRSDVAFDLIISDWRMSPVNGLWLLSLAKEVRPSVPVVIVTAYYSKDREEEAVSMGADRYIAKPFDADLIVSTVRELAGLDKT